VGSRTWKSLVLLAVVCAMFAADGCGTRATTEHTATASPDVLVCRWYLVAGNS
jgi:hypothetical protein